MVVFFFFLVYRIWKNLFWMSGLSLDVGLFRISILGFVISVVIIVIFFLLLKDKFLIFLLIFRLSILIRWFI